MSIYSGFVYERRPGERNAGKCVEGDGETRDRNGVKRSAGRGERLERSKDERAKSLR